MNFERRGSPKDCLLGVLNCCGPSLSLILWSETNDGIRQYIGRFLRRLSEDWSSEIPSTRAQVGDGISIRRLERKHQRPPVPRFDGPPMQVAGCFSHLSRPLDDYRIYGDRFDKDRDGVSELIARRECLTKRYTPR